VRRQCQRREEHSLGAASFGTDTLLVSAMGSALKVASGTTLPMGVRSLAALVTCAIAVVIVVHGDPALIKRRSPLHEPATP
jgi:hypothetical protein